MRAAALAAALLPIVSMPVGAQACATRPPLVLTSGSRAPRWPAPLDRVVAPAGGLLPLGEALDRLATASGVRFSYSPDLLPLRRVVCLDLPPAPLGAVLTALLGGTNVGPIVARADQVVLAPLRSAAAADALPVEARSPAQLDRVVVTGTATGAAERSSPHAIAVVDIRRLPQGGARSLAAVMDGAVPGVWVWRQSPTTLSARWGSVRGASSFGVSTPKVYLDGIEVANPLLLDQLDPARIERVEVIRGPQGAALYGADAISGVVQIVSRRDAVGQGAPRAEVRSAVGTSASDYADGTVLTQDHAAVLRFGTAARSATAGTTLSTIGSFVPDATSRQLLVHGSARQVGARTVATGTLRFQASDARVPTNPLLTAVPVATPGARLGVRACPARAAGPLDGLAEGNDTSPLHVDVLTPSDSSGRQRVRQYTLGGSVTLQGSPRWTHALIAGVDGYRLAGVAADGLLVPSAVDSALLAARGGADRASLRLSSTAQLADSAGRRLTMTLGAEHSTARERTNGAAVRLAPRGENGAEAPSDSAGAPPRPSSDAGGTSWWSSTGVLAQGQLGLGDRIFLTGGGRVEHLSGPSQDDQVAFLPMLGAAWVEDYGVLTVKLRASYGRGIRPARTVARGATWSGGRGPRTFSSLSPEEQSGVEAGVDLLWGTWLALHATRFDQRASGLVQPVAQLQDRRPGPGAPTGRPGREVGYVLQNVGAIDNRGWELQATAAAGPLALGGTLSLVGSRVARLARGYTGDLRLGDRMLEVPRRTVGLTAAWTASRWSTSWSAARATDWINYDRLALAADLAAALEAEMPPDDAPVGARLRDYWRSYGGVTRVGGRLSFALRPSVALSLDVDNLLGQQLGEPDNVTVLPGRTITFGVRTGF